MHKYYVAQFNKKGNLNMGGATGHDTMESAMDKAQAVLRHATSDTEALILTPVGKVVYEDIPVKFVSFEDKTMEKALEPLHTQEQIAEKQKGMRHPMHGAHFCDTPAT